MNEKSIEAQLLDLQEQVKNLQRTGPSKSPPSKLRAEKRYYQSIKPFSLRFKQSEDDIWDYFNEQANKTQYLKNLIVKDMGYKNWAHYMEFIPIEKFRKEWDDELREKQSKLNPLTSHTLKTLMIYVESHDISVEEWKKIEELFYFDDDVSTVACDALFKGVLPYDAWTPEIIAGQIEDLYYINGKHVESDWHLFEDEDTKKKFLYPRYIDRPGSKLDTHIKFFCVDQDVVEEYYEQTILSDEPLLFPAKDGVGYELISPDEARRRLREERKKNRKKAKKISRQNKKTQKKK